jgi:glycosyltransferase involved in cell wall biosynthesis
VVGFVREPELAVAAFDVAVYPSLSSEGMGRVVFEYMAAGRPIVATRIGLAAEVLRDGETAWLVDADDPGALAAAIVGALTQPARGRQQSQACRRLVETSYSGAVVTGAIERLYVQSLAPMG